MRTRRWLQYVLAYAMWAVVLALGIWLLLLSRDAVVAVFSALLVEDSTARTWTIVSVERFYVIGAGLAWLALMILSELYFRNGVRRGRLFPRFARILGIELLLLFIVDFTLFALQGMGLEVWSRWLILGVELVLGVACVLLACSSPRLISDVRSSEQS
ncbi:MAG: hypothetical protein ACP5HG_10095 [Anaerolineae bacterium]